MRKLTRGIITAALALAVAGSVGACSTRAGYDEVVLYYRAGAGDNREFASCIEPGHAGDYPVDDEVYSIPTTTRTWSILKDGGDTNVPIDSGSKPGPEGQAGPHVATWATVDFYINTDCTGGKTSPIVKFWETLGRRYSVSSNDAVFSVAGFKALLQKTLIPAEAKAIAAGTRFYTADQLDGNTNGEREEMEKRIAPMFAAELRAKLGGDFFCGVGYDRGRPVEWDEYAADGIDAFGKPSIYSTRKHGTCPPPRISVIDNDIADPAIAAARAAVYAAEQRAKANLIAAQNEKDIADKLGQAASNEAYLRYKAIQAQLAAAEACKANPNCTVIIDGTGHAGVVTGR
jgi:hypothetical protein